MILGNKGKATNLQSVLYLFVFDIMAVGTTYFNELPFECSDNNKLPKAAILISIFSPLKKHVFLLFSLVLHFWCFFCFNPQLDLIHGPTMQ